MTIAPIIKSTALGVALIIILITPGCLGSKENKHSLLVYNLKNYNNTESVFLSNLGIEDIQYISLQTAPNFLISRIEKIKSSDSSFFIWDSKGKILQFKVDGHFINQIGSIGKGPGEYLHLSDFDIDNLNKEVFILPLMREPVILTYNFNGKFLENIACPRYTRKICRSNDEILCWSDNWVGRVKNKNNIFLINKFGEITKSFPDKYKYLNLKLPNGFLEEFLSYSFNEKLYIKEIYSDTVFVLQNDILEPALVIDHGGKTITVSARESINNEDRFSEIDRDYSKEINLFQFGDYIYSEFALNKLRFGFIGSFKRNMSFFFNSDGIINDIDGGPNIRFRTLKNDNSVISWFNAYELKAHVASEAFKNSTPKYPEKKKELEKLANSLHENDNPVLMLVKLKE